MSGRAWRLGDDIDTDVLAPGIYIKLPPQELAIHCLESVNPAFARNVRPGDYVVAGKNFGAGSSREQAAQALKVLGVAAVIAPSFGGIFYRNAFNLGLPAIVSDAVEGIEDGHSLSVELAAGRIINETTGMVLAAQALPENLMALIEAGGLVPYLARTFNSGR